MSESNLTYNSNVYKCKGNPLFDEEFIEQIIDIDRLEQVRKRHEVDFRVPCLSRRQMGIIHAGKRCTFSKNDPCIGYYKGKKVNRCMNMDCPGIKDLPRFHGQAPWKGCNPDITQEDINSWIIKPDEKELYENLTDLYEDEDSYFYRKYYLVDLVSDQEMRKYNNTDDDGSVFPPDPDPIEKKKKTENIRKKVVIGYEETCFGDYADTQMTPIWGYVDDTEDAGPIVERQYGGRKVYIHEKKADEVVIEVKSKKKPKEESISEEAIENTKNDAEITKVISDEEKKDYESNVKGRILGKIQLTEMTTDSINSIFNDGHVYILLGNEAEMAYVSSMLLQIGIDHDIETRNGSSNISLWHAESENKGFDGAVMVSQEFLRLGCNIKSEKIWKNLQYVKKISELSISGREFFGFDISKGKRWGCRNLYGATHLAIKKEDLRLNKKIDQEQQITLLKDENNYIILLKSSAEQIGITTYDLWETLESLKKENEITDFPIIISGLKILNKDNGVVIKGIGHMKFDEY